MSNALEPAPQKNAVVGNHGAVCATQPNNIPIGAVAHRHVAAQWDYDKKRAPARFFIESKVQRAESNEACHSTR